METITYIGSSITIAFGLITLGVFIGKESNDRTFLHELFIWIIVADILRKASDFIGPDHPYHYNMHQCRLQSTCKTFSDIITFLLVVIMLVLRNIARYPDGIRGRIAQGVVKRKTYRSDLYYKVMVGILLVFMVVAGCGSTVPMIYRIWTYDNCICS